MCKTPWVGAIAWICLVMGSVTPPSFADELRGPWKAELLQRDEAVRFEFGAAFGSSLGRIGLDEVEITKD